MPTIFTHAAVSLALAAKARGKARLLLACALCSVLPDADVIGFRFGVQYNSLFGHRGFTHSFFFAALLALAVALLFERRLKSQFPAFLKIFLLLFAATATHPLLDALTDGGEGVAFFSPFSNHRYFFPWRPLMVSPIGVGAFFGWRGLVVLASEAAVVLVPLALALWWRELLAFAKRRKALFSALALLWIGSLALLNGLTPLQNVTTTRAAAGPPVIDLFTKQYANERLLELIPTYGIRGGKLVTSFLELQRLGLFNNRVEARNAQAHWASGFFPNWFGGIAGRWQDSNPELMLRTVFGFGVASSREILGVLKESGESQARRDFLFRLSPTEKYDLATGDYGFKATNAILAWTHNAASWPKFWYGICNGMAAAALWYEEPYRAVEVINPNGFRIRFHPNDVKALLGFALANAAEWTEIGVRCNINGPDARGCRINPGAFFLATMNRIALARDGFIVDGFAGTRKQFYLFDAVRVEVLKKPRPVEELPGWTVPTPVREIAEVRFTMDFVSTLLSDKDAGLEEEKEKGEGFYRKVGRVVVPRTLDAVIALGADGAVIGGAWLGEEDVPDVIFFPGPLPAMDAKLRLKANLALSWPVIQRIYEASVSSEPELVPVDLSL